MDVFQRLEDRVMSERVEFWRGVVERQGRSGRSVRDFCRREGVSTASFYTWRRRLGEREAIAAAEPRGGRGRRGARSAFVAVNVRPTAEVSTGSSGTACIEIVLPGDVTIHVSDGASRETLVDVLAAVREASA